MISQPPPPPPPRGFPGDPPTIHSSRARYSGGLVSVRMQLPCECLLDRLRLTHHARVRSAAIVPSCLVCCASGAVPRAKGSSSAGAVGASDPAEKAGKGVVATAEARSQLEQQVGRVGRVALPPETHPLPCTPPFLPVFSVDCRCHRSCKSGMVLRSPPPVCVFLQVALWAAGLAVFTFANFVKLQVRGACG